MTTPRHDYIFVDESGDPGFNLEPGTGRLQSSSYYSAAALHLCDDAFRDVNRHIAAFRYYTGLSRELKIPSDKDDFSRLLGPIRALAEGGKNIWASAIYVEGLQVVHHVANAYKNVVAGGFQPAELSFVKSMDLTLDQHVQ